MRGSLFMRLSTVSPRWMRRRPAPTTHHLGAVIRIAWLIGSTVRRAPGSVMLHWPANGSAASGENCADVPGLAQPFLLEAVGRCPPEDIGGPLGYREMLDALADPRHARHDELVERYGSFDPAAVDLKGLEAAVDALAAQTRPTTTRRKPSPANKSRP